MAGERHALLGDLAQPREREHLKPARVRENRAVPAHEAVQPAQLAHHIIARTQMQMIGIRQLDLAAELLQVEGADAALDGGLRPDIHENRRLHHAAMGTLKLAPARAALCFDDLEHESNSSRSVNRAARGAPPSYQITPPRASPAGKTARGR